MASGFGKKLEEMSIEELEASLDRLIKASGSDSGRNSQVTQYREDEVARLSEELHRRRGTRV